MILNKEFLSLINKICDTCHWINHDYKLYFYILITRLIFIVECYFAIKKTVTKYSSMKVSFSLSKACTLAILSSVKSFIKSTTSLLIYCSFFVFNTMIKNKKTGSEYYRKKIIMSLLKAICSLTLNIYKVIIISLKLSLWSLYNQNYFGLRKTISIIISEDELIFNETAYKYYLSYIFLTYNLLIY